MAIIDFSAFNQYEYTGVKVLLNTTSYIKPDFKGVTPKWIYQPNYYTSTLEVPASTEIEKHGRLWQRIHPNSNVGTTARNIAMIIDQDSIDPELRVPGNTITFGFKFGSAPSNLASGRFLGYRAPSTAAVTTLTMAGTTIGPNQMRWIDWVIKYEEENVVKVAMYCNKDLIHSFETTTSMIWGLGVGNINTSLHAAGYGSAYGFFLNDFLTSVDKEGETNPTGQRGPITVKTIYPNSVRTTGNWVPPAGKTIQEALTSKRKVLPLQINDDEVIRTDPQSGTMTTTFAYPTDEVQPILAFRETMIAKSLLSESAMLQWQRIEGGKLVGKKTSVRENNTGLGYEIKTDIITPKEGNEFITELDIASRGLVVNSTKKTIPSDD